MQKLLCVLMSVFIVMSFTACKEEESKDKGPSVDLEYYAKSGSIPECEYSLGANVEELKEALESYAESDEGSESFYDVIEGEDTVCVTNGVYNFYYEKDNEDDGIAYIASFDKAFGFEIGESILVIKDAVSGIKYTEEEINDDNAFFMFVSVEGSVIKCEFEKNTIMFVFENNALCATAIYRNDF